MISRYYILRDHTLYIYKNREQKIPQNIISLRGLYIEIVKSDKRSEIFGFTLKHENNSEKTRTFYHRNQEAI